MRLKRLVHYKFDIEYTLPWSDMPETAPNVLSDSAEVVSEVMGSYSWAEEQRTRLHIPSEVYYCIIAPLIAQVLIDVPVGDVRIKLQEIGIVFSEKSFETLVRKVLASNRIPAWSSVRNGCLKDAIQRWLSTDK